MESGESELESDLCTLWDASVNNVWGSTFHTIHDIGRARKVVPLKTFPSKTNIIVFGSNNQSRVGGGRVLGGNTFRMTVP